MVTLNVHGRAPRWRERRAPLVRQLSALDPDIVALQELNTWPSQGHWLARALNGGRAGPPYAFIGARKRGFQAVESIGVVTRLPVAKRQMILLGAGGRVTVRCRVQADRGQFDFYCAHFHHGSASGEIRLAAARTVLAMVDTHPGVPVILAGDLNGAPESPALELLSGRLRSAYAVVHGSDPDRTAPTNAVYDPRVLDYILVSPEFDVLDAELAFTERDAAGETVSDHFGLAATLSLSSIGS